MNMNMNVKYVVPAVAALILSACASQSPAPVVDGTVVSTGSTSVYTPNSAPYTPSATTNTANTNASNPYGATPYTPSNTASTNYGTEAYPVHTDSTVYTPSNTSSSAAYTPTSTYVGNYAPVDVNATYHTVVAGDTVYNISKRYGISQDNLRAWNGLVDNTISKGQRLRVKPQGAGASNNTGYTAPVANTSGTHQVAVGDTVYNISKRYGMSQEQLRSLNNIAGNNIHVGQVLRVNGANNVAVATTVPMPEVSAPATTPVNTPTTVASSAAKTFQFSNLTWQSPLPSGRVSEKFTEAKRNIKIAGSQGQIVQAAADGQVIFSGAGPRGYGNLVVVQHTPQYLSAYGNNQTLAVKELQQVKRGDTLGTLGSTGNLVFEIRQNGKPIDPLSFMQL